MSKKKLAPGDRVSFWIPVNISDDILNYLNTQGKTKSQLIIEAIEYFLSQNNTIESLKKELTDELKQLFLEYLKNNKIDISENKSIENNTDQIINRFVKKSFNQIKKL